MDKQPSSRIWAMRVGFLALALLIMFFQLLPLETIPRRWAPPDLLVVFVFAWSLRRPDYIPALSVAVVMLMADLLFQRPPGLLALLVVIGSEYLKGRAAGLSEAGFVGEWAVVTIVLVAITVLNRVILSVLVVDQASLALSLIQMIATIAAYPVVVLVTQSVMGVRKPQPGGGDGLGARA